MTALSGAGAGQHRPPILATSTLTAFGLALLLFCVLPGRALADSGDNNDMVVFGGQHETVNANQEVQGDLVVIGGSADVLGKVDGDAVAIGGRIYIAPQGRVQGSLVNLGGVIDNQSTSSPGRGSVGPTQPFTPPAPEETPAPETFAPMGSWHNVWFDFFAVDALLAFFAFLLFPVRTASTTAHLKDNPLLAGILGFFSPIIFVLVLIALAITLVGIPLMPLAVIATIAGYLLGKAAIADFIGSRVLELSKRPPSAVAAVGIGLGLLFLITALTGWIGVAIYFCIAALAIGAALYMLMRTAEAYRATRRPGPPPASPPESMHFPAPQGAGSSAPVDPAAQQRPQ